MKDSFKELATVIGIIILIALAAWEVSILSPKKEEEKPATPNPVADYVGVVKAFRYNGHEYLQFITESLSLVHNPDCPCTKPVVEEAKEQK